MNVTKFNRVLLLRFFVLFSTMQLFISLPISLLALPINWMKLFLCYLMNVDSLRCVRYALIGVLVHHLDSCAIPAIIFSVHVPAINKFYFFYLIIFFYNLVFLNSLNFPWRCRINPSICPQFIILCEYVNHIGNKGHRHYLQRKSFGFSVSFSFIWTMRLLSKYCTSTDYKTNTNSKSLAEKIPRSSSALSSSICFSISRCAQMSNAPWANFSRAVFLAQQLRVAKQL